MLGEAGCAEMKLMDLAMNHRDIAMAQFTTTPHPSAGILGFLRRHPRWDFCLYRSGLKISAEGGYQSAQR